ncbi:Hypothetical protein CAP_3984 [Chondromyces apiculatus DSM 436]|uniref:Phosphodiester glycosidase domain-containing protein n=2 Tax=Chondromyces apiculatus TaxID=51 RepID=A0A017THZ3_9BACT|nr:Hypothetical protein CAP_3984 [Chondromyces apiculatus DSM 436]
MATGDTRARILLRGAALATWLVSACGGAEPASSTHAPDDRSPSAASAAFPSSASSSSSSPGSPGAHLAAPDENNASGAAPPSSPQRASSASGAPDGATAPSTRAAMGATPAPGGVQGGPAASSPGTATSSPGAGSSVKAFPPPSFAAVHARTAKPEDGTWTPLPEGAAGGPPVLARTTVHPHTIKPHVYVHVIAVDLRRVGLHLVAGTLEPEAKEIPAERRPGLVPAADQTDLIAVFNGGFMARHGKYGMRVGADVFLPPRPDACTVALYQDGAQDGAVRIGVWSEIEASAPRMTAFRQTPPCLVSDGALHPNIEDATRPRRWSAAENGEVEIRRSALGIDASGQVLFYGSGEWITAKDLATAMKAAGAVDAAQLDINYSYTKFLFYGRPAPGDPLQVVSTLIQDTKHTKRGYVASAAERDFFYLKRRATAGTGASK